MNLIQLKAHFNRTADLISNHNVLFRDMDGGCATIFLGVLLMLKRFDFIRARDVHRL